MTANQTSAAQPITPSYVPTMPASFALAVDGGRIAQNENRADARGVQADARRDRTGAQAHERQQDAERDEREERIDERQRLRVALEQSAQHLEAVLPRHFVRAARAACRRGSAARRTARSAR